MNCCFYSRSAFLYILLASEIFDKQLCSGKKGVSNGRDDLANLLRPCLVEDAMFLHGLCEMCLQPLRFKRVVRDASCYTFDQSVRIRKDFLATRWPFTVVFDSQNRPPRQLSTVVSFSKNCSKFGNIRAVGCLRQGEQGLEEWRIRHAANLLRKRKLRVVTIERHPFVKIPTSGNYTGVLFEFMNAISEKYNFSMTIFLPYDGNWGAMTSNGSWNGMVGQVLRGEADLGVAGFSVTFGRSQVIAFSNSYYQEETAILIPRPISSAPKLTILIRPLSSLVWALLFTTVAVLTPVLYCLHIMSLRISGAQRERKSASVLIGEILHFIVGSLVQESIVSPVNKTTRFLIVLWWFFALTLANIYVAYLVSYLSAPKLVNVIDSLNDLVNQDRIKWTFRKATAHQSLFKSATSSGIYKQVGDGVALDDLVQSDAEGINRVLEGDYAFIKEKSFLDVALGQDFLKTRGECRMTVAKERFFKVETALILNKESPYLDLINREIIRSVTSGLMEKWKALHWERLLYCEDAVSYIPSAGPPTRKLGLSDFLGAWFLLGSGLSLAVVAFLGERLRFRCTKPMIIKPKMEEPNIRLFSRRTRTTQLLF